MSLHPKKIDLSLGRLTQLLARLGNPQHRLPPVIHVAGTNGKGSTIAFMRAICEAAGLKVHTYTSPHLVHFHERIYLGGHYVTDAQLLEAFEACERTNDGAPITFFEMTTAAAFLLYSQHPADVLLLEVGLGGRYDATNVINAPQATIITSLSMDHMDFLGNTIEAIALEKAGIFKPHVPAFSSAQPAEARHVLEQEAAKCKTILRIEGQDFMAREEFGRLVYEDEEGLLDLPLPRLLGRHQHHNAALAIAALRKTHLEIAQNAYKDGIKEASWPGRLQAITTGKLAQEAPNGAELWLDGGHNEGGGRVLSAAIAELAANHDRPLVLICGMLNTKDVRSFLNSFKGLAQEMITVPILAAPASHTAHDLAQIAQELGVPAVASGSVEEALRYLNARVWEIPPRILITGSLYLAGQVLATGI